MQPGCRAWYLAAWLPTWLPTWLPVWLAAIRRAAARLPRLVPGCLAAWLPTWLPVWLAAVPRAAGLTSSPRRAAREHAETRPEQCRPRARRDAPLLAAPGG